MASPLRQVARAAAPSPAKARSLVALRYVATESVPPPVRRHHHPPSECPHNYAKPSAFLRSWKSPPPTTDPAEARVNVVAKSFRGLNVEGEVDSWDFGVGVCGIHHNALKFSGGEVKPGNADAFGKKLGYATSLRAALVKLQGCIVVRSGDKN
ncbi:hypothetical protein Taro_051981 [Colocasia esculenta]|uniref:Uncharacterized protein n=1 Tax=Colocasia esculenta TaxID=4460 RepID=A0A843XIH0_COLES|nr:hypothetical protein [Colocasia esculenta]